VQVLELQRDAVAGLACQMPRAGTIGQHPAQEMRIEIGVVASGCEARALEQPRRELGGRHHGLAMLAVLQRQRRVLQRRHARCADAVMAGGGHRRGAQFGLQHVGEARQDQVAGRGCSGKQVDIAQRRFRIRAEAGTYRLRGKARAGVQAATLLVDGVVPRQDAVLAQDATLDPRRHRVDRRDETVDGVVVDGRPGKERARGCDVDVVESHAGVPWAWRLYTEKQKAPAVTRLSRFDTHSLRRRAAQGPRRYAKDDTTSTCSGRSAATRCCG
jgi:hypothetical protein